MTTWDHIDVDFGGDETGNFGPREESGSALYQVDTVATVTAQGEVTHTPPVCAAVLDDDLCIAAGNHVSLFKQAGHQFIVTLAFVSEVDCVCWSDDAQFLVVGENSGTFHFIHSKSQKYLLSQRLVQSNDDPACKSFRLIQFTQSSRDDCNDLVLITSCGQMFRFSYMNLDCIAKAIEKGDLKSAKTYQNQIQMCKTDLTTDNTPYVTSASIFSGTDFKLTVAAGDGDRVLSTWRTVGKSTALLSQLTNDQGETFRVVKCKLTNNGRLLFVLDADHYLSIWDTRTLVQLSEWKDAKISDFMLQEIGGKSDRIEDIKMVLLTPAVDGKCTLQLLELPTFNITYSLQLNEHSTLADFPVNQEGIYVMEGVVEEGQNLMSSIRVRCLTESQPETRLYRILHKGRFEEAEEFAKLFNLDVELVYKVKASFFLDQTSPWNASKREPDDITTMIHDLKECLLSIRDDSHVTDCCVKACLPTFHDTLELLNYARTRLEKNMNTKLSTSDENISRPALLTNVLDTLHRLGTFQVCYGIHKYSGAKWDRFLKTNLLHETILCLRNGLMSSAFTIFNRHQSEFEEDFSHPIIQDILSTIPEQVPSANLKPWLSHDFIPFIIRVLPTGLDIVAKWLEERAKSLEYLEKTGWPENGLSLAEVLQNCCSSCTQNIGDRGLSTPAQFVAKTQDTKTGAFGQLQLLVASLKDLVCLHNTYNCKLTLAQYLKENTESITYRMLDKVVAIELIPQVICDIIKPYMKEHGLSEDKMLFQYIQDLMRRSGRSRSYVSTWEPKAIAVIKCIQDAEYKCQAILRLMTEAFIPWSKQMQSLVDEGLALDHPRVSEIREQSRVVELIKMLTKYELKDFVPDPHNAQALVYYILSQDLKDSLDDALKVVSAYNHLYDIEAYCFRLRFLIANNRLPEVSSLVGTLPDDKMRIIGKRIISHAIILLNDPVDFDPKNTRQQKSLFIQAALLMLRPFMNDETDPDWLEYKSLREELCRIQELQARYNEFVTLSSYRCPEFRKALLRRHVEAFFTGKLNKEKTSCDLNSDRKPGLGKPSYSRMYRLAEVLQVSCVILRGQLAVTAAKTGEVNTAIKICRELYELAPSADTASVIYKVVHSICVLYTKEESAEKLQLVDGLPLVLLELASQAVAICSTDLLADCLELYKCVSLMNDVCRQCESGDYDNTVQGSGDNKDSSKLDPYRSWTFDKFFKEDGLVLDSSVAVPMACEYSLACMPSEDLDNLPYQQHTLQGISVRDNELIHDKSRQLIGLESLSDSAVENVQYFRENNLSELAFRYTMHTTWTSLSHLTKQNMGAHVEEDITDVLNKMKAGVAKMVTVSRKSLDELTIVLLMKVFNHKFVDRSYALGLMCRLPKQAAFDRLKKMTSAAGLKYKRVLSLARVGIDFARLTTEPKVELLFCNLEANALWGHRLAELKISFAEAFKGTQLEKSRLLPHLVQQDAVDLKLIIEYCRAFQLDENKAFLSYLDALLLPTHLKGSAKSMSSVEITRRQAKVQEVIRYISDQEMLVKKLQQVVQQLDPYSYEQLSFVLNELNRLEPSPEYERDIQLLVYLNEHTRSAPPSEYEMNYRTATEEEQILYGGKQLCDLAYKRIPFHPLVKDQAWKIISSELTAENVEIWVLIARLLKLSSDQIYLTAIQNIIKQHNDARKSRGMVKSTKEKSSCNWNVDNSVDMAFFDNIRKLLMKVTDCKLSVACTGWIVKELPMGAEKVLALKACVALTQKWFASCPEKSAEQMKAKEANEKYLDIYSRLATEQVLYQNNLGEHDMINLANSPAKLIFKLYEHPSIPLRFNKQAGLLNTLPDIHKVTDDIASINKTDVTKIRLTLVEQWLPTSNSSKQETDADMTVNLDFNINLNGSMSEEQTSEDDHNLKRVTYILQHGSLKQNCLFLLNFAFKRQSSQVTSMCRVRALQCLFALADNETIEKLSSKRVHEIREQMQVFLYLGELERLHVPQTYESFEKSNKEGLVRGIWRNHCHEEKAVRLVSDLCLDYEIYDVQLWNSILQQLLAFGMMDYLRHVLVCLSGCPDLWQVGCIQKTWNSVLMSPLSSAVAPLSDDQKIECLQTAKLLHRCPLVLDLDVLQYSRQFVRLEMPGCALACVLLISDSDKRKSQIQALLKKGSHLKILDEVNNFLQKGEDLNTREQIQDTVFEYTDIENNYNVLAGTVHFQPLINYLVGEKRINSLLLHAIKANRLNEATQLVALYLARYPDNQVIQMMNAQGDPEIEKLKSYLRLNNLFEEVEEYLPIDVKEEVADEALIETNDESMDSNTEH